jgi:hypothetical protein
MVVTAMILACGIARLCRVGMADSVAHQSNESSGIGTGCFSRFGGQGQHPNNNAHEHGKRRQEDRCGPAETSHVMLPELHHSWFRRVQFNSYALQTPQAIEAE